MKTNRLLIVCIIILMITNSSLIYVYSQAKEKQRLLAELFNQLKETSLVVVERLEQEKKELAQNVIDMNWRWIESKFKNIPNSKFSRYPKIKKLKKELLLKLKAIYYKNNPGIMAFYVQSFQSVPDMDNMTTQEMLSMAKEIEKFIERIEIID